MIRLPLVDLESDRNWKEDYVDKDNGCYMNKCIECKLVFFGHKRRVVCKSCTVNYETVKETNNE